jgi:RNA polymerase sigma-70 factor (ECF subfamily)
MQRRELARVDRRMSTFSGMGHHFPETPEPSMDHAFSILAAEHRPMLLAYAKALCYGDGHAAEDVVQETLLVALRRLEEFRAASDGHFGRWLRGIARNKALEAHRAGGRGRVVADSRIIEGLEDVFGRLDAPAVGDESWEEAVRNRVRECVGRLTARLRSAVQRVYGDGLKLDVAAAAEGASYAAFAQRLSRARELVRVCIEQRVQENA